MEGGKDDTLTQNLRFDLTAGLLNQHSGLVEHLHNLMCTIRATPNHCLDQPAWRLAGPEESHNDRSGAHFIEFYGSWAFTGSMLSYNHSNSPPARVSM